MNHWLKCGTVLWGIEPKYAERFDNDSRAWAEANGHDPYGVLYSLEQRVNWDVTNGLGPFVWIVGTERNGNRWPSFSGMQVGDGADSRSAMPP